MAELLLLKVYLFILIEMRLRMMKVDCVKHSKLWNKVKTSNHEIWMDE